MVWIPHRLLPSTPPVLSLFGSTSALEALTLTWIKLSVVHSLVIIVLTSSKSPDTATLTNSLQIWKCAAPSVLCMQIWASRVLVPYHSALYLFPIFVTGPCCVASSGEVGMSPRSLDTPVFYSMFYVTTLKSLAPLCLHCWAGQPWAFWALFEGDQATFHIRYISRFCLGRC
jgi:hypothetical protein